MLTKRENAIETIRGGRPDRLVNQYEYLALMVGGYPGKSPVLKRGETAKNEWGVTYSWPEDSPAKMPICDSGHVVVKDIENWRSYVKAPSLDWKREDWQPYIDAAGKVDRDDRFVTAYIAPGVFEQCHNLLEIANCLMALLEEPEIMHEIVDYLTDWEMRLAECYVTYIKPDAVFHHDDWGTQISTFMSVETFREFFLPAYKRIYGLYKDNGVELVVHHSDSYAETLVPSMLEMGIDVWQGAITTNDIPGILREYGDRMAIQGGLDSGLYDVEDWSKEKIAEGLDELVRSTDGAKWLIPCLSAGGPGSCFRPFTVPLAKR